VDGHILIGEANRRYLPIDSIGRAYLFDALTGQLLHTFNNPEPTGQDRFARAITGGDDQLFISTIGSPESVYVFSTSTGGLLRTIPRIAEFSSNFGSSLAYDNGSLLVAEPSFMNATGRAHLFDGFTGELRRTLLNPEPKEDDLFGGGVSSVAVLGNKIAVGALLDDLGNDVHPAGDNPGRVWVFDRATGEALLTLENPNADNQIPPINLFDRFGSAVAAGNGMIVVGAPQDSTSGSAASGTVYVFDSETGALRHTLFSPRPQFDSEFGRSVAVAPWGDVLVGAYDETVNGVSEAGHAYLFDGESGSLLLDLVSPEPSMAAGFGWSVAASENQILVSAVLGNSDGAPASGVVYVFEGIPEPGTTLLGAVSAILITLSAWRVRLHRRSAARGS
jgi:outer membrane protein assembly factor BamB